MARLIKTPAVAAKLSLSVETFYRRRAKLRAAGFPDAVAPFRDRWSEEAVTAWINRAQPNPGDGADRADADAPPADDDLTTWAQTLRDRARHTNL